MPRASAMFCHSTACVRYTGAPFGNAQIVVHHHHVSRFHRDVAGSAIATPIGLRQRRCVVDAVSGHRRRAVLLLHRLDRCELVLGQQVAADVRQTGLAADGLGSGLVVTGQHHWRDAHGLQLADGGGRRGLDRVGHREERQHPGRVASRLTVRPASS